MKTLKINDRDNVAVMLEGDLRGHKIALSDIKCGEDIKSGTLEYSYNPIHCELPKQPKRTFMGYKRADGSVGIRNEIWIVNTVGCVNKTSEILAREANKLYGNECGVIFNFVHPFGCSQLGDDQKTTQAVLKGLVNHANAAGVLVLGLGCENNNIPVFKEVLGTVNENRIKFMSTQDYDDEIEQLKMSDKISDNAENKTLLETDAQDIVWQRKIMPDYSNYMGLFFESVCKDYLCQMLNLIQILSFALKMKNSQTML